MLIIDDIWSVEHAAFFRIGGPGSTTLMTTRLNEISQAIAPTPADIYRLDVLAADSALELLNTLAPDAVAKHTAQMGELVRDLEGLPLAIQVAGRLLQNEMQLGWGVEDLLLELRQGVRLLDEHLPSDMVGDWNDTARTVTALLKRSTDALDSVTRACFADLGLFVPKPATFDLGAMATLWDMVDPKPTARVLVNRGLLEPLSGGRFQMHSLLMLHARTLLIH